MFNDLFKAEKVAIVGEQSVLFRGLNFGDSPAIVVANLGEPRFGIENHGISSSVYFYKEKIGNHRVVIQIHFLGSEFFYACCEFRDESQADRKFVRRMLFEKYAPLHLEMSDTKDHLVDRGNSIVSIYDNVNFRILYLWGDDKIRNAVSENIFPLSFSKEEERQRWKEDLRRKL